MGKNRNEQSRIKRDIGYFARNDHAHAFDFLETGYDGLQEREAQRRIRTYGSNVVNTRPQKSAAIAFLSHFANPMIIVLMIIVALSLYLGELINASIVGLMIIASVVIDFFEEHNAGKAAEQLREQVQLASVVVRDGVERTIINTELVPGDVIVLNAGDLIPADARLISASDLFVNQSVLTGESFPCEKRSHTIDKKNVAIGDMDNIVFMGAHVMSGFGRAVVVVTGTDTTYGGIVEHVMHGSDKSDFEVGVQQFGYFIMRIIVVVATCVFFFNILIDRSVVESVLFSIAIAIALTPEFLPMIMSITMARGSIRMAKKGVIVKKLAAIPNLGSMTVLCTDKTGTLTEDKIALVRHEDVFGNPSDDAFLFTYLNSYFQTGVENTLDHAVLAHKDIAIAAYRKIDEIPFNFSRKSMSIVVEHRQGFRVMITKGAPEEIIQLCDSVRNGREIHGITPQIVQQAVHFYNTRSMDGFRVIAVAAKYSTEKKGAYVQDDECGLTLVGFVSFLDPAKKDVAKTLQRLDRLGIETKIITGDNDLVAQKICRDVGLTIKGIMQGSEITQLSDDMIARRICDTTIFARCSPYQKKKIVTTLRNAGHVVGYMGDGINDAPSIVAADVGISVNNGVDIAKESADIVLTHKNLNVLIGGVMDGRISFGNTMKYIMMGLSGNFGNMIAIVGAVIFLPFLPMLPLQILLNNFLYDLSHIGLSTDNVDEDWLVIPRQWDMVFVKKFMIVFGTVSALFNGAIFFMMYRVFAFTESAFQTGWFIISIIMQILIIHIIRTRKVPFVTSNASPYLYFSTLLCVAVGVIVPYTFVGTFFGFVTLPVSFIMIAVAVAVFYMGTVEVVKRVFFAYVREMHIDAVGKKRYI